MEHFKASVYPPLVKPDALPPGFTLRRMSWLQRTVRYEWPGEKGEVLFSPTFSATVLEWERALD